MLEDAQSMAATLLGEHMETVQRLVEAGNRHVSEHAPIPHHNTVERSAVNWVQVLLQEVVMRSHALVNQLTEVTRIGSGGQIAP